MPLRTHCKPFCLYPSSPRRRGHYRAQGCADAPDAYNQHAIFRLTDSLKDIRIRQRMKRVIGKAFRRGDAELLDCRKVARSVEQSLKRAVLKIGRTGVGRLKIGLWRAAPTLG